MTSIVPNDLDIAAKIMDGEAILINLKTGIYYSLDKASGALWEAIGDGTTTEALSDVLVDAYGIEAAVAGNDAELFVAALLEENLVLESATAPTNACTSSPQTWSADAYHRPEFERFDDMAEMFALDPPLPGLANKG